MRVQVACDLSSVDDAIEIVKKIKDDVEIIECGTGLIFSEGCECIRKMKAAFPDKLVLADLKIMDGGVEHCELVFKAGADLVTVMGVAPDETIKKVCDTTKKWGKECVVDMMCVNDQMSRAKDIISWGANYLCLHTADDQKDTITFYHFLKDLVAEIGAEHCSIAGGMNPENILGIKEYKPDTIIVGGYITRAADPVKAVKEVRKAMED